MTAEPPAGFRHFHDQLGELKDHLLEMSSRAEELVELSVDALVRRDIKRAAEVIAADREIDQLELDAEQLAVQLLALQQPMARDLRFLIGAIKVISDIERVGDHAVNIAESVQRMHMLPPTSLPEASLAEMARLSRSMLADSLDAFVQADGALGRDVCRRDDEVDAMHDTLFRVLLTHMMADPRTINPALELLLVSRNLERVADIATNISEDAVYLAEGKQIKHRSEVDESPQRDATPGP
ncbi:MAG: phosphate signaling complex protein PhoU [Gemmatimonadaceae bacterium]|jgi:phosphate transport system protein